MKPTPNGWPRLSSAIFCKDADRAIDWLCKAFGFEVRIKVMGEGGVVMHSELTFGEAVVTVGDERNQRAAGPSFRSPLSVGGANTQAIMFYVDDVAAHCERARAAGGKITMEPTVNDYGAEYWADKSYQCVDPEGHAWWFCERVRG